MKSINLASAAAPVFYNGYAPGTYTAAFGSLGEVHFVYGIGTSDGGIVMCGKASETDGSANLDAVVMKVTASTGTFLWGWRSNILSANEVCNGLAQLPSGGDILMAGYQTVSSRPTGCLMKLSLTTGTPGWSSYALFPASSTNSFSALESVSVSATYGVLVPGVYNIPTSDEMNFHSYGNGM